MHLYQQLQRDTVADRDYLLAAPAIQRALAGDIRDAKTVIGLLRADAVLRSARDA